MNIRSQLYELVRMPLENGTNIANLVNSGVLSEQEARTLMDTDRLFGLIAEAHSLSAE